MRVLDLEGTPSRMGEDFGSACRTEIQALYRLRVEAAADKASTYGGRVVTEAQLLKLADASIAPTRAFDEAGFEELEGMARGADLDLVKLLAMNGLTDFWDAFAWSDDPGEAFGGCTAAVVHADRTVAGHALCGQTWDLATDNMPFVVAVRRRPTGRPATRALTCVGCLSLMGLNDRGLAVGTTNVRTHDARAGVTYVSLIHRALACGDAREAEALVTNAHRAGAHFYFLVDGAGTSTALELTGSRAHRHPITGGAFVQGNHSQVPAHQAIEAVTPVSTSPARCARMEQLLREQPLMDLDALQRFLGDTVGGADAICRDDVAGISSNGAVVMEPATGTLRLCHGPPSRAAWIPL